MVLTDHIVPDVDEETEYRRIVRERLNALFGPKKNQQENQFVNAVLERGRFGFMTMTYFIMTCYVMFALAAADMLYKYPQYTLRRCFMPELEGHFSDDEISTITYNFRFLNVPHSVCYYEDRNYTELLLISNYSYEKIMTELRKRGSAPLRRCKDLVKFYSKDGLELRMNEDDLSFYTYYNLHCTAESFKSIVKIVPYLGFTLHLPLGILTDLYGRRLLFMICYVLMIASSLVLFIPNKFTLLVARFFLGTGRCSVMVLLIIFLEQCNVKTRHYIGFVTYVFRPMGRFFVRGLSNKFRVYYLRIITGLILILPVSFILWFIRTSPRWQYFRGRQKQAWMQVAVPAKLPANFNELSSKLNKISLREHMSLFCRIIYRLRTTRHLFLMFSETLISSYYLLDVKEIYSKASWNYFVQLNSALLFFTCSLHVALMFLTRKTVLLTAHFILLIACAVNLLQTQESDFVLVCDIIQKSISEVCLFLILFQSLELFPTLQRGTIVGMSMAVVGVSAFVIYTIDFSFREESKTLFSTIALILVIICTALAAFIPETYDNDLPDLPREALSSRFINVF